MEIRPSKPFGSVSALPWAVVAGSGLGTDNPRRGCGNDRLAAEQGITHFDMAPMYGRAKLRR